MGYDLRFKGGFTIEPPLTPEQSTELAAVGHHAVMADGPMMRICWRPTADGDALEWDGCEKFAAYAEALEFLQTRFFAPRERILIGVVRWEGEDGATGTLSIADGAVVDQPDETPTPIDDEVSSWIEVLNGHDRKMRVIAASQLSVAEHASAHTQRLAVAALAGALNEAEVAKAGLETLGTLGSASSSALGATLEALDHEDPQVRYWATFALGRMGPPARDALPKLERLAASSEDGPRYGALDAIRRLSSDSVGR